METRESIAVQIGQVKIGGPGQTLNAILGSCIGIGFLHPEREIYGLAHALLAKSDGPATVKGDGRHVDHAIESLLSGMGITNDERRSVRVILAGGANMTMPTGTEPERLVGSLNAEFAVKAVRQAGLRIRHSDLGGDHGRRVEIDCDTGEFTIKEIPRLGRDP